MDLKSKLVLCALFLIIGNKCSFQSDVPSTVDATSASPTVSESPFVCPVQPDLNTLEMKEDIDIIYSAHASSNHYLDVYRPNSEGQFKTVVAIHGGGWMNGDKSMLRSTASSLVANGYAVVAPAYRLASADNNPFPAAAQDLRCAIKWLKVNGDQYQLDTNEIVAMGGSAGGHLASMLGTTSSELGLDHGECPFSETNAEIQGVISFAGSQDFTVGKALADDRLSIILAFLGGTVAEQQELAYRASPAQFVSNQTPPFLLVHGILDDTVPVQQSEWMESQLTTFGVAHDFLKIENAGHELANALGSSFNYDAYCRTLLFLSK